MAGTIGYMILANIENNNSKYLVCIGLYTCSY